MNTISFNQSTFVNTYKNNSSRINTGFTPTFTGKEKVVKKAKLGPVVNFFRQSYGLFFVPSGESVTSIGRSSVFTKKVQDKGLVVISNKYSLFSKKPQISVVDDYVMKMRKKVQYNPDGTQNIEFRDMHNPNYRVSVGYENASSLESYSGSVQIHYVDEASQELSKTITPEERKDLLKQFDMEIEHDKSLEMPSLSVLKQKSEYQRYMDNYYRNPSVIGKAILSSPECLESQLNKIHSSMPYGIETILSKLAEMRGHNPI